VYVALGEVLARADTMGLSTLMPAGAASLARLVDPELVYPSRLLKILRTLRSDTDLLQDDATCKEIFQLLRREEARELAARLGGESEADSYRFLSQVHIRTREVKTVSEFFGVTLVSTAPPIVREPLVGCDVAYPMFRHQIQASVNTKVALNREPYRALLHMPTGAGKTRTAMNLVSEFLRDETPRVVVWLAHSEELCEQAAAEFESAWGKLGNRKLNVGRHWGATEIDLAEFQDGLIVAGLAKLFAGLRSDARPLQRLRAKNPFVIMDEAHQAIAPTYQQILEMLVSPTSKSGLLGLSATPGRSWNDLDRDEELAKFFGYRKIRLEVEGYDNPVTFLIDRGYLARPTFRTLVARASTQLTESERRKIEETFDIPTSALERLGIDQQRNLLILHEIEELLRRHKRIIVFAASVQQSDLLAAVLNARGRKAASVTSRQNDVDRDSAIVAFKSAQPEPMALCNFGILTTGFDAPKTSGALIARPTLSLVLYSQMVGRAMRGPLAGGNPTAEIVTVVDPQLPGFDSVQNAFANWEDVWRKDNDN
jgi:DNA repair protein RadD